MCCHADGVLSLSFGITLALLSDAALCMVDPTNYGPLGRGQCHGANAVCGNLQQSRVLGVASTLFVSVMDGETAFRAPSTSLLR